MLHEPAKSKLRVKICVYLRNSPKLRRFPGKLFRRTEKIVPAAFVLEPEIVRPELADSFRQFRIFIQYFFLFLYS